MKKLIAILLVLFSTSANASVYLDGSTSGCTDGATTYAPATRACGSGSDTVHLTLATFESGIVAGATNYIRSGNYWRDNVGNGSLDINDGKGGSSGSPTIIKAYPGEERQAVIGTATRQATYNSDPGDVTGAGSWLYYPNSAMVIYDTYVTIDGLKFYGHIEMTGADNLIIKNCDIGGGGSGKAQSQGEVLRLENSLDILIDNNYIHNSCIASDSENNSPNIIMYNANATITHNTFDEVYAADIFTKDSGNATGKTTDISLNFFLPSSISGTQNQGVMGHIQDQAVANIYVHNNIFFQKDHGIEVAQTDPINVIYYNNTFINCTTGLDQGTPNGGTYYSYNNLFYQTGAGQHFSRTYTPTEITADYNIYYTTSSADWLYAYSSVAATSLADWRTFSGEDANSITSDPDFVDAAGATQEDFKRSSYAENFTGSSYGVYAGAYETGTEQIGYDWGSAAVLPGGSIVGGVVVQ